MTSAIYLYLRLLSAESAWGKTPTESVSISLYLGGRCSKRGDLIAITEPVETKVTFDSGEVYTTRAWRIRINSDCDWSKHPADLAIQHEVGHALGLQHSQDPSSIMYWIVKRGQRITLQDRKDVEK